MLLFVLICQAFNAQTYSYSFSGVLSSEKRSKFNKEISELHSVFTVDLKIKTDSEKGEIVLSIDPSNDRGENEHPFSPVDLKSIIIAYGLEPIEFRQIK